MADNGHTHTIKQYWERKIPEAEAFYHEPKNEKGSVRGMWLLETSHKVISQINNYSFVRKCQVLWQSAWILERMKLPHSNLWSESAHADGSLFCWKVIPKFSSPTGSYNSIDRRRVMQLLKKYTAGPRI